MCVWWLYFIWEHKDSTSFRFRRVEQYMKYQKDALTANTACWFSKHCWTHLKIFHSWSWCLLNKVFWFHFVFFLSMYVYSLFDISNLVPMSIILCYELGGGGVCVCVCVGGGWVHVCLDVGLGREGPGLGLLFFLCCLWVGVGICL